jgi:hypothetical protein
MFLSAVSGGLVALGLMATATRVGTAFYAFGLVLLPTMALIGVITFLRVLQSGIEDHGYARRMSRLRAFYLEEVPQLAEYMPRVPAQERLHGLSLDRRQGLLTAAGMVAVVTAVLIGGSARAAGVGAVKPLAAGRAGDRRGSRRCGGAGAD